MKQLVTITALLAPVVLLRITTGYIPVLDTLRLGFYEASPALPTERFVGLDNHRLLWEDDAIRGSVRFTLVYSIAATAVSVGVGLVTAWLLKQRRWFEQLGRIVALMAWGLPVVVVGSAFKFGLDSQAGLISDLVRRLTGAETPWLSDPTWAQIWVIGADVYKTAPFCAIVFLSALHGVPRELEDAARVDGAGSWATFVHVQVPMIRATVVAITVFLLIFHLNSFDLVLAMTGGGPGTATQVLSYSSYLKGFQSFNFGVGAAFSSALFLIVVVTVALGTWAMRKSEIR